MKFIWRGPNGGQGGNHTLAGKAVGEIVDLAEKMVPKIISAYGVESLEAKDAKARDLLASLKRSKASSRGPTTSSDLETIQREAGEMIQSFQAEMAAMREELAQAKAELAEARAGDAEAFIPPTIDPGKEADKAPAKSAAKSGK
ncbi:hypothetical protein CMI47_11795 [Candidatus Pacearchaeota archaeon]|nr:hypothetical protein [Candidatus Pacearchaeota archaeon]